MNDTGQYFKNILRYTLKDLVGKTIRIITFDCHQEETQITAGVDTDTGVIYIIDVEQLQEVPF